MAETVTHTLDVPGGVLVYDVTGPLPPADGQRALFMIGHPMGSSGFAELASHFPDRTVVSYDPRGCDRSEVADADHSPRQNAEDVHQLIGLVGGGPVDVFGSSGGAVTGLALVSQYPDDVGVLVAHEPPILGVLPDAANVREAFRTVTEAYHQGGFGAGMAAFIALTSVEGEFTSAHLAQPAPDPAMFGLPTGDDGGRDNVLLSGISDPVIEYRLDPDAVDAAPTTVVIAAGEESRNQVPGRAAAEVARILGTELAMFPSHHGGFNGGEGPYAGKPVEFAAKLREVLAR
ncbi:MAG TPA: alpha/beta hydrolase [Propionicimonas sp.]|jgi:pimeloyl-ACP methyl ester carboxylesterase|uniref:alpha/beta fold hydrolase n=1 Tax=Propionicimonas sp. TaxID=1955623 RepID=UPI002F414491